MRLLVMMLAACGGGAPAVEKSPRGADPEATFGPLEIGADYARYVKLTDKPFLSLDHGNRWVEVYVNEVGAAAYESSAPIPVGTIIVKSSWLDANGAPSQVAGPLYVMEKRAPGYAPAHGDWWFAIHWAKPPAEDAAQFGGPLYWRGHSKRVDYCEACHDDYDRSIGGLIPSSILKR
ncbi:MAG: cytochrome P460 family protein [Deltaproteobacteria bacterium]|nr:cytochrome P460 family protein [Deltaproteobacteria bacterium]MDQ3300748.1 cytochrome P460 family protein [Myxococcota bacterium]